jgi:predicted amidohydrolase
MAGLKLLPARWDKAANFAKLDDYARRAVAAGAEFVVTPEGYLEGYVGNFKMNPDLTREKYLAVAEPLDGPWMKKIEGLARELRVHLLIGFAERRGDRVYNSAALIAPDGKRIGLYSKSHTGGQEPFNDEAAEFPVFDTAVGRFGLLVCFDRQLPETSRILAIQGAQMILVPAFGLGIEEINEDIMMRTRAYENGVYVAHVHPKNTFVVDPEGKIVAQNRGEDEGMVLARIKFDERIGKGPIRFRRPSIYGEILRKKQEK